MARHLLSTAPVRLPALPHSGGFLTLHESFDLAAANGKELGGAVWPAAALMCRWLGEEVDAIAGARVCGGLLIGLQGQVGGSLVCATASPRHVGGWGASRTSRKAGARYRCTPDPRSLSAPGRLLNGATYARPGQLRETGQLIDLAASGKPWCVFLVGQKRCSICSSAVLTLHLTLRLTWSPRKLHVPFSVCS